MAESFFLFILTPLTVRVFVACFWGFFVFFNPCHRGMSLPAGGSGCSSCHSGPVKSD